MHQTDSATELKRKSNPGFEPRPSDTRPGPLINHIVLPVPDTGREDVLRMEIHSDIFHSSV